VVQHEQRQDPEIDLSSLSQEELRAFHKTLKRVTKGGDSEQKPKKAPTAIEVVSNGKS
jgi:hypothetical protein